ncbi:MAG: dihydroorotase [Heliobacteriaceae bacterium]|jgi:dihydroorotase|nr:dihydroorotase [Heliobacteriaceae bacterium]
MIKVPAFVEMHCHLREPGFEEKETIETGSASAIAGGYAAVCPMANTNPVNDNPETLKYILSKAKDINIYPICAITKGLAGKELTDMKTLKESGAAAFSDDGRPIEDMGLLYEAMQTAKELDILLISHAEDSSIHDKYKFSEDIATARELEVLRSAGGTRYHFAHVSTKRSIDLIRQAKKDGLNVTCETAPHYFSLSKEDIIDARFKVNPPLRGAEDVEAVIEGLKDGTIDVIATDHAPHTLEEKQKSWADAPMGIAGFETAFGAANTYLVKAGHLTLEELIQKMSYNPTKILGISNKGNFALIDEDFEWTVKAADFKSKCKISPFEGKRLTGKVIQVITKKIPLSAQNAGLLARHCSA